jgi:hypothetical protein
MTASTLLALVGAAVLPCHVALAAPPPQDVNVVNSPSNPVPTTVQGTVNLDLTNNFVKAIQSGTWNVGIVGTPSFKLDLTGNTVKLDPGNNTVKAEQSGTWNVGIAGTPTVSISGTPTVTVGNTAAAPVLVRNLDEPARQRFQQRVLVMLPDGLFGEASPITVPDGKYLVIEHVSASCSMGPGQKPFIEILTDFTSPLMSPVGRQLLVPTFITTESGRDLYLASQPMRLYSQLGGSVDISVFRRNGTSGPANVEVDVSGHLVDP